MTEDSLRAAGASPDEARHLGAQRLGHVLTAREAAARCGSRRGSSGRVAGHPLRRPKPAAQPGFTLTALATLTLGIGVNTTLFALVNALLLQPWRLPDPDTLVLAHHRTADQLVGVSVPELAFLQQHATSLDLAASRAAGGSIGLGDATRQVRGRLVERQLLPRAPAADRRRTGPAARG